MNILQHIATDSDNLETNHYPLGSMPREDNSLRKMRLIQAANAVLPSIFACSSNCWRKPSDNLSWYCGDLFSALSVDMVRTINYYLLHGNYHSKKAYKKQTLKSLSPLLSVLITTLLKRSKSMTNYNSTPYTAQGVSKIQPTEQNNSLPNVANKVYAILAFAKSEAERGNSNNLHTANITSTPKNRAIFVCGLNTPKENNPLNFEPVAFLSMVAFSGQRLIVGCIPYVAVFHPAKRYRQTVESKAIVFNVFHTELSAMIYLFKA